MTTPGIDPVNRYGTFPTELDRLIAHDLEDVADRMLGEYAEQRQLEVITSRPIQGSLDLELEPITVRKLAGYMTFSPELLYGFEPRQTRLQKLRQRRRHASLAYKTTMLRRRARRAINEARIRLARLIGGQHIIDDITNNECRDYDW